MTYVQEEKWQNLKVESKICTSVYPFISLLDGKGPPMIVDRDL
jgi:hypothetical protein